MPLRPQGPQSQKLLAGGLCSYISVSQPSKRSCSAQLSFALHKFLAKQAMDNQVENREHELQSHYFLDDILFFAGFSFIVHLRLFN